MGDRNNLRIENDALTVVPRGMDKVWSFRRQVVVPLSSISEVSIEPLPLRVKRGWRGPGLDTFTKLSGTFHPAGERHFWNYSGPGEALTIRLNGSHHFHQLYLSVDDAGAWRDRIIEAIKLRISPR